MARRRQQRAVLKDPHQSVLLQHEQATRVARRIDAVQRRRHSGRDRLQAERRCAFLNVGQWVRPTAGQAHGRKRCTRPHAASQSHCNSRHYLLIHHRVWTGPLDRNSIRTEVADDPLRAQAHSRQDVRSCVDWRERLRTSAGTLPEPSAQSHRALAIGETDAQNSATSGPSGQRFGIASDSPATVLVAFWSQPIAIGRNRLSCRQTQSTWFVARRKPRQVAGPDRDTTPTASILSI